MLQSNHPKLPFLDDIACGEHHGYCQPPARSSKTWNERKKSIGLIRTDLTGRLEKTESGFPIVKAYHGQFPNILIGINEINNQIDKCAWLHGFSEDYVLERLWNRPECYIEKASRLGGILSPDYSLYLDMTSIEKRMNIFRRNAISQIFQNKGIEVIHTLCWAEPESLDYCIDGVEGHGIYAISNIGVNNNYVSRKLFRIGLKDLIRRLEPKGLIVYGYPLNFETNCDIRVYENKNLNRLHRLRK